MDRDELVGFGIGLATGVVVGGVVALLFAPQSGAETRQAIKDKAEGFAGDVRAKFNKAKMSDIKP